MLSNYLKVAWRSLARNKLYSFLNVSGLALGTTVVIFIALYLMDELTFDKFHHHSKDIYRVLEHKDTPEKGEERVGRVALKVGMEAKAQFPEVLETVRFTHMGRLTFTNEETQSATYCDMIFSEPSIGRTFDFTLEDGKLEEALEEPNTVVLSREIAQNLFGTENPVGKVLLTDRGINFTVSGVLKEIPSNSHLQFQALFSWSTLYQFNWWERYNTTDWNSNLWLTYLHLKPGVSSKSVEGKLTALIQENRREEDLKNSLFELQPLESIHLHSEGVEGEMNVGKGDWSYLYIFGIVGLFILFIACVNYMNLATARSANYGKEVGIRKVAGADRRSLIFRFLSESWMITGLSFVIALNLVYFLLPWFNNITGKVIHLEIESNGLLFIVLLLILSVVGLLSGSYPAVYLSRFQPVNILKGAGAKIKGNYNLRQLLVVGQFVLSIVLIIGTLTAFQQFNFISGKDLGFNKEALVVVDINSGKVRNGFSTIKEGYEQLATVSSVSVSSRVPGEWKNLPEVSLPQEGQIEKNKTYFIGVDEGFLSTFEIEMLEGRNFDPSRPGDSTGVLINEQAAKLLGIDEVNNQAMAIDAIIFNGNERALNAPFNVKVLGIVKDFHFQSLHEPLKPLIMGYRNNPLHSIDYFTVRVQESQLESTIASLTEVLHSVDPDHLFEYHFLNEQIASFYEADLQRGQLFSLATGFAIFIACLGLFGLAAYTAEQRTKEIGIRKVLGASVGNLIKLLSKDFLQLVVIALVIAIPLGWYGVQLWLGGFAYSVPLSWWMFVVPGFMALLIAWVTVSFQSIRVALANPTKALRSE